MCLIFKLWLTARDCGVISLAISRFTLALKTLIAKESSWSEVDYAVVLVIESGISYAVV